MYSSFLVNGIEVTNLCEDIAKVTLEQVESNIFNFNGNLVIQLLQNSELLTYSDLSNDLDFFSKIRYTVKGPNSIGSSKSERNISVKYRGTDPSYIGG